MFLLVQPNGAKYWRFSYRFLGKQKTLALGVYPAVTLATARKKRDEAREQIAAGVDPGEAKKDAKRAAEIAAANSFEAVAREWFDISNNTMLYALYRMGYKSRMSAREPWARRNAAIVLPGPGTEVSRRSAVRPSSGSVSMSTRGTPPHSFQHRGHPLFRRTATPSVVQEDH